MGVARLGRLIQFVPYPVTTGFTAGIAVVTATLQLKDFLGLSVARMPEEYLERVAALARALPSARWQDVAIGVFTLAILILWPRVTRWEGWHWKGNAELRILEPDNIGEWGATPDLETTR
jgi:SulP family sulfate permease